MPYNENINVRMQKVLLGWDKVDPRKMFGGTCYLMNGNMVCGVWRDYLILTYNLNGIKKVRSIEHTFFLPVHKYPLNAMPSEFLLSASH